jgi:cytochrome b561
MIPPRRYARIQIWLHWILVVLVTFQIVWNDRIGRAYHAFHDGVAPSPAAALGASLHIYAGIGTLVLGLGLLAARFRFGAPPAPAGEPAFLRRIALLTKVALYAMVIGMPLSGLAAWYLDIRTAGRIHGFAEMPAILLILLHFAGACYQHFWRKSDVLRRMLPFD